MDNTNNVHNTEGSYAHHCTINDSGKCTLNSILQTFASFLIKYLSTLYWAFIIYINQFCFYSSAYVEKYLLEKSRLVYQEHNERYIF